MINKGWYYSHKQELFGVLSDFEDYEIVLRPKKVQGHLA